MVKKYTLLALIILFKTISFGLPNGNDFLNLIGQPASHPEIARMLMEIEMAQHNASFDRNANIYEIKAFESGIALLFNQNFILKLLAISIVNEPQVARKSIHAHARHKHMRHRSPL